MARDYSGCSGSVQKRVGRPRLLIDDELKIVSLAIIGVMAVVAAYPILSAGRTIEPFTEFGVLGSNGTLGDYPSQVVADQKFNLQIYVGDHEGGSAYYRISAKLVDQKSNVSDTKPLDIAPIDYWDVFLMNGGNITLPVTMSVNRVGLNQRLIFELGMFEPKTNVFVYKSWTQLWLNVTKT